MIFLLVLFALSVILYLASGHSYGHLWKNIFKYKVNTLARVADSIYIFTVVRNFKLLVCDESILFFQLPTYCYFAKHYTTDQCQCH